MQSRSSATGDLREQVRAIFEQALEVLDVESQLTDALLLEGSVLSFGDAHWDLGQFSRVLVLSIGKAAIKMARAAHAGFSFDQQA